MYGLNCFESEYTHKQITITPFIYEGGGLAPGGPEQPDAVEEADQDDDPEANRRRALTFERMPETVDAATAAFGVEVKVLRDCQDEAVCAMSGKKLGKMTVTFAGSSLECRCASHGHKCRLLLAVKGAFGLPMGVLKAHGLMWLAAGAAGDATSHREMSLRLRRDIYKMRVRG